MKIHKYLFFVILLISLLIACDNTNEVLIDSNAYLIWTGDFDQDGCGYFVQIDTTMYKPVNEAILPFAYKREEPLSITVQYIDLLMDVEYTCGDSKETQKAPAIKLTTVDPNEPLD